MAVMLPADTILCHRGPPPLRDPDSGGLFRVAAAAGSKGSAAKINISLPSSKRGSNTTGAIAPIAEPAIEAK